MSKVSEHIKNKYMWLNSDGKWCKSCPKCNREIVGKDGSVTTKFNVSHSIIKGKVCHSCIKVGKPTWSSLNPQRMSELNGGKNHPMYGRHHTDEMKKKQSERYTGKILSDETKKKLRIAAIKQHRENGINFPSVDKGATEYFDNLNLSSNFAIQHPNIEIKELGYFVDGYDPVLHAIFEYDTKSHNSGRYKKKDFARQQEIVEYYRKVGNPLSAFYRINKTGHGEEGMKNVINNNKETVVS